MASAYIRSKGAGFENVFQVKSLFEGKKFDFVTDSYLHSYTETAFGKKQLTISILSFVIMTLISVCNSI
jgi:hypothetical protein